MIYTQISSEILKCLNQKRSTIDDESSLFQQINLLSHGRVNKTLSLI